MASKLFSLVLFWTALAAATNSRARRDQSYFKRHSGKPTVDGITSDCVDFYKVCQGDTCNSIADSYGHFSTQDFIRWNPPVGPECLNLWLGYYYCVGVSGSSKQGTMPMTQGFRNISTPAPPPQEPPPREPSPQEPPASKAAPTPPAQASSPQSLPMPSPIQDGMVTNCSAYYKAVAGDTCDGVVEKHGMEFTFADFLGWNPAVGTDCDHLLAGYYYCVGPQSSPPCSPNQPEPTQPGSVCWCKKWHYVVQGDVCDSVIRRYDISASSFHSWNPQVGWECQELWKGYHVCVGT
ncbi:hypothetical protein L249_2836 [Ophiocordyceps polyrhachis-furcata BCC 54312]|uniref:LysM domain-containing protein n=1 Tax=Ophiocordyceps polyrhachis-furcata BCC 54312 TaxID=1330021 RepID=A0A367LS72_9HYPO|nr:hypothetical protein L249_2836 [Ophiocordyceps polyrhachis-furcata BCC 54312]